MKKASNQQRLKKCLLIGYLCVISALAFSVDAFAAQDIFAVAKDVIVKVYNSIAGISTALAGLMSAVAVVGAKMSNNQHKVDQSWDWRATRF